MEYQKEHVVKVNCMNTDGTLRCSSYIHLHSTAHLHIFQVNENSCTCLQQVTLKVGIENENMGMGK